VVGVRCVAWENSGRSPRFVVTDLTSLVTRAKRLASTARVREREREAPEHGTILLDEGRDESDTVRVLAASILIMNAFLS
jgi:hypothetical protein